VWNIAFKFNEPDFADQLKRLAQAYGRGMHEVIKQQGGLLLEDITRATPPRGSHALAATAKQESWAVQRRIGYNSTKTGVESALKHWPKLFGEHRTEEEFSDPTVNRPSHELYRLMKAKKFVHAQTLLDSMNMGGAGVVARGTTALHKSLRKNGRVPKKTRAYIVAFGPSVNGVVKKRQQKVGLGKSGWMKGAEVLGTLGKYPTWITRHGANGAALFSPPGGKVSLWVKNTMKYMADFNNEFRIVSSAITSRRAKLEKEIQKVIAANTRKQRRANRKTLNA